MLSSAISLVLSLSIAHFLSFPPLLLSRSHPLSLSSLYLGNPMDPPDVLGLDLNAARPTQLPGRAKSEWPIPKQPTRLKYCQGIIVTMACFSSWLIFFVVYLFWLSFSELDCLHNESNLTCTRPFMIIICLSFSVVVLYLFHYYFIILFIPALSFSLSHTFVISLYRSLLYPSPSLSGGGIFRGGTYLSPPAVGACQE